jgi:prepilin-type N-terminal cleavage/methylation domain-containing protein
MIMMKSNFRRLHRSDIAPLPPQGSPPNTRSVSGFTLIESLVAIIILSLTVVSVLPPIFWATATRVQNRRAEQAMQLAQGEVDRVRAAVERDAVGPTELPPKVSTSLRPDAPAPSGTAVTNAKLRSSVPGCSTDDGSQPATVNAVILVDTDPEPAGTTKCTPEYIIQTFRGSGPDETTPTPPPRAFVMGVRVYAYSAKDNIAAGKVLATPGTLRGGTGLGTQQTKPLAMYYSTIVRSSLSDGLQKYRALCKTFGEACYNPEK